MNANLKFSMVFCLYEPTTGRVSKLQNCYNKYISKKQSIKRRRKIKWKKK